MHTALQGALRGSLFDQTTRVAEQDRNFSYDNDAFPKGCSWSSDRSMANGVWLVF